MAKKTSTPRASECQIRVRGATAPSGTQWVRIRKGKHSAWLPRFDFMLDVKSLKHRLAAAGLYLGRSEFAELENLVAELSKFPPKNLIETPGWTNGCFALPSGQLFAPKGARAIRLFQPDLRQSDRSGSLGDWLSVVEQLRDQHLAVFMIMAAFVVPIEIAAVSLSCASKLGGRALREVPV